MKTKLLVATLLAGSSMFAETHFSIGIGVGGPRYVAPPVVAYAPARPGPGFTWVEGYWTGFGYRRIWHPGYWERPRYGGFYREERFDRDRFERERFDRDRFDRGFRDDRRFDYDRDRR